MGPREKPGDEVRHPGKRLAEVLENHEISPMQLANHAGIPEHRVYRVLRGEMAINLPMACRLAQAFRTTPEYWMHQQALWDVRAYVESTEPLGFAPFKYHRPPNPELTGMDICLCGHWGHEHIDYPTGGCVHTEKGIQCLCPMYIRLGGFLAHEKLLGIPSVKERLDAYEKAHSQEGDQSVEALPGPPLDPRAAIDPEGGDETGPEARPIEDAPATTGEP